MASKESKFYRMGQKLWEIAVQYDDPDEQMDAWESYLRERWESDHFEDQLQVAHWKRVATASYIGAMVFIVLFLIVVIH